MAEIECLTTACPVFGLIFLVSLGSTTSDWNIPVIAIMSSVALFVGYRLHRARMLGYFDFRRQKGTSLRVTDDRDLVEQSSTSSGSES